MNIRKKGTLENKHECDPLGSSGDGVENASDSLVKSLSFWSAELHFMCAKQRINGDVMSLDHVHAFYLVIF